VFLHAPKPVDVNIFPSVQLSASGVGGQGT